MSCSVSLSLLLMLMCKAMKQTLIGRVVRQGSWVTKGI